jgi:hypothetical protein
MDVLTTDTTEESGTQAESAGGPPDEVGEAVASTPSRPLQWRRIAAQATGIWLATRIALAAFTYLAVLFRASGPRTHLTPFPPRTLFLSWQRWDALWYLRIAQQGYSTEQATAFFPLYPLLVRIVAALTGGHWLAAALVVANLGTLGGFIGLALLAAHEFGRPRAAWSAVYVAAAYPLAFFLAAPYTDGLFLAFAVFALFSARRGAWQWAALCAFLAALTRPTGVILVLPLLWEYGRQHAWWRLGRWREGWREGRLAAALRSRQSWRRVAVAAGVLGAVPAALGLYMLCLWWRFGDPLLFLHAEQRYWSHATVATAITAHPAVAPHVAPAPQLSMWTYDLARSLVDIAPVVVFAVVTLLIIRRLPLTHVLYMAGLLALCIAAPRFDRLGIFVSAGRYLCAAVPAFMLLGRWAERYPWLHMLLVSGGFLAQAVLAEFFLMGGWLV